SGAFQEKAPEPARDDVRETLKTFVLLQLKDGGGELTVPYKTEAGRTITAKVLSGTEDELKLSAEGNKFSATWEELGDPALSDLVRPLLGKGGKEITIACLTFGVRLKQSETKEFQA